MDSVVCTLMMWQIRHKVHLTQNPLFPYHQQIQNLLNVKKRERKRKNGKVRKIKRQKERRKIKRREKSTKKERKHKKTSFFTNAQFNKTVLKSSFLFISKLSFLHRQKAFSVQRYSYLSHRGERTGCSLLNQRNMYTQAVLLVSNPRNVNSLRKTQSNNFQIIFFVNKFTDKFSSSFGNHLFQKNQTTD